MNDWEKLGRETGSSTVNLEIDNSGGKEEEFDMDPFSEKETFYPPGKVINYLSNLSEQLTHSSQSNKGTQDKNQILKGNSQQNSHSEIPFSKSSIPKLPELKKFPSQEMFNRNNQIVALSNLQFINDKPFLKLTRREINLNDLFLRMGIPQNSFLSLCSELVYQLHKYTVFNFQRYLIFAN